MKNKILVVVMVLVALTLFVGCSDAKADSNTSSKPSDLYDGVYEESVLSEYATMGDIDFH